MCVCVCVCVCVRVCVSVCVYIFLKVIGLRLYLKQRRAVAGPGSREGSDRLDIIEINIKNIFKKRFFTKHMERNNFIAKMQLYIKLTQNC